MSYFHFTKILNHPQQKTYPLKTLLLGTGDVDVGGSEESLVGFSDGPGRNRKQNTRIRNVRSTLDMKLIDA